MLRELTENVRHPLVADEKFFRSLNARLMDLKPRIIEACAKEHDETADRMSDYIEGTLKFDRNTPYAFKRCEALSNIF
jgi:hypothetical protein